MESSVDGTEPAFPDKAVDAKLCVEDLPHDPKRVSRRIVHGFAPYQLDGLFADLSHHQKDNQPSVIYRGLLTYAYPESSRRCCCHFRGYSRRNCPRVEVRAVWAASFEPWGADEELVAALEEEEAGVARWLLEEEAVTAEVLKEAAKAAVPMLM
jgi:hypothetical protein